MPTEEHNMTGESKDPLTREELVEVDRMTWSLPWPRLAPVRPVREVWPFTELAEPGTRPS